MHGGESKGGGGYHPSGGIVVFVLAVILGALHLKVQKIQQGRAVWPVEILMLGIAAAVNFAFFVP